jgi:hypothetical protein
MTGGRDRGNEGAGWRELHKRVIGQDRGMTEG